MADVRVFCFLASYGVALGFEFSRLFRRNTWLSWAGIVFVAGGFAAHTAFLLTQSGRANLPPLLSSGRDWLLVLAWVTIVLQLVLKTVNRESLFGLFLLPVVLFFVGSAYFISDAPSALVQEHRGLKMTHASLLVFGTAGVVIGFVVGAMYVAQHKRLRSRWALLARLKLPSLERLARWNWWAVVLAVPLLTLGMASGIWLGLLARESDVAVRWDDPLVLVNSVALAVMLVFMAWLLKNRHPSGRQVAWMTIWAFGFLLLTMIGLLIAGEGSDGGPHTRVARHGTDDHSRVEHSKAGILKDDMESAV